MPYVLIQEEGGFHSLDEWSVSENAQREYEKWSYVCQVLVKRAIENQRTPAINVFLVFDQDEVIRRDRPALTGLIRAARSCTWGASLLLVLSNVPLLTTTDRSAQADLAHWLWKLLEGRVADVLEISEHVDQRAPSRFLGALRDRASATQARRDMLNVTAGHRAWRCVLPRERLYLADFLGPELLLAPDEQPRQSADTLVVLSADDPERQKLHIERYLPDDSADSHCRVVTYIHEPALQLLRYCEEKNLPEPVSVRGDFELWYLLLRLNEYAREHRDEDSYAVHPVSLVPGHRLTVRKPDDVPAVLITSTFNRAETGQWLAAAHEIGELMNLIPFGIGRRIELGATPERLTVILPDMPEVLIWIHIGHGDGTAGLRVPGDDSIDVEKWLGCFSGRDLRLALFLTCNSDEAARRFAREGANVAIGFDGNVESHKTWHLAVEIVKAIAAEGTRGGTILAGFDAGLQRFEAVQKLDAKARAYYPRQA